MQGNNILKACRTCLNQLPRTEFYASMTCKDGLLGACKKCHRQVLVQCRAKARLKDIAGRAELMKQANAFNTDATTDASKAYAATLYIICNPLLPDMVKIGRADHPAHRARVMSGSHPFKLIVCHEYPGHGSLEGAVHDKIKHLRVVNGSSHEWFRLQAETADAVIRAAMEEWGLSQRQTST